MPRVVCYEIKYENIYNAIINIEYLPTFNNKHLFLIFNFKNVTFVNHKLYYYSIVGVRTVGIPIKRNYMLRVATAQLKYSYFM